MMGEDHRAPGLFKFLDFVGNGLDGEHAAPFGGERQSESNSNCIPGHAVLENLAAGSA